MRNDISVDFGIRNKLRIEILNEGKRLINECNYEKENIITIVPFRNSSHFISFPKKLETINFDRIRNTVQKFNMFDTEEENTVLKSLGFSSPSPTLFKFVVEPSSFSYLFIKSFFHSRLVLPVLKAIINVPLNEILDDIMATSEKARLKKLLKFLEMAFSKRIFSTRNFSIASAPYCISFLSLGEFISLNHKLVEIQDRFNNYSDEKYLNRIADLKTKISLSSEMKEVSISNYLMEEPTVRIMDFLNDQFLQNCILAGINFLDKLEGKTPFDKKTEELMNLKIIERDFFSTIFNHKKEYSVRVEHSLAISGNLTKYEDHVKTTLCRFTDITVAFSKVFDKIYTECETRRANRGKSRKEIWEEIHSVFFGKTEQPQPHFFDPSAGIFMDLNEPPLEPEKKEISFKQAMGVILKKLDESNNTFNLSNRGFSPEYAERLFGGFPPPIAFSKCLTDFRKSVIGENLPEKPFFIGQMEKKFLWDKIAEEIIEKEDLFGLNFLWRLSTVRLKESSCIFFVPKKDNFIVDKKLCNQGEIGEKTKKILDHPHIWEELNEEPFAPRTESSNLVSFSIMLEKAFYLDELIAPTLQVIANVPNISHIISEIKEKGRRKKIKKLLRFLEHACSTRFLSNSSFPLFASLISISDMKKLQERINELKFIIGTGELSFERLVSIEKALFHKNELLRYKIGSLLSSNCDHRTIKYICDNLIQNIFSSCANYLNSLDNIDKDSTKIQFDMIKKDFFDIVEEEIGRILEVKRLFPNVMLFRKIETIAGEIRKGFEKCFTSVISSIMIAEKRKKRIVVTPFIPFEEAIETITNLLKKEKGLIKIPTLVKLVNELSEEFVKEKEYFEKILDKSINANTGSVCDFLYRLNRIRKLN
jgi:hypothetical protein